MLFDLAWRDALVRFGAFGPDEFDPDNEGFIGINYGYPYLNLSVQRVLGVRMPGASPDVIDSSFFGTTAGVPTYQPDPRDESPRHTERVTQVISKIMATTELPRLDEDRRKARTGRNSTDRHFSARRTSRARSSRRTSFARHASHAPQIESRRYHDASFHRT
ncbi:hypothetical protein [Rhodococcus jostii]|uniref:hypothetical protein n=1 Tax=Rhodococcus jostii TaxID=132919 RepID=UPI0036683F91